MRIGSAARPGGHLRNEGGFLLRLLTTPLPTPVKGKQEGQRLSVAALHRMKSFVSCG